MEYETKEKAWDMWVTSLPYMDKKISFNDFYNKIKRPVISESNKTTEQLLEWAEEVKKAEYKSYIDIDKIKTS